MKVVITESSIAAGRFVDPGEVLDLPDHVAQSLIAERKARLVEAQSDESVREAASARPATEHVAAASPKRRVRAG